MALEQWLNTSVYGLALAAVAWAAARPRLFDAAWRGRLWGAALVGLAVVTTLPLLPAPAIEPALAVVAGHRGPGLLPGHGGPGLLAVPALAVPTALLLFVWGVVALSRATALALAVARIRAARAAAKPVPQDVAATLPEWTAANVGRFALVLSDRVPAPSMLGFGRPMIAIPRGLHERLSGEALDAILLHELAHAERRDDLFDLAQQLLIAACWFHPAAWWIGRRIAFEREAACDERAVRVTDTTRYARCLVAIAEALHGAGTTRRALVASSAARGRQLRRRVERLLAFDRRAGLARSCLAASVLAGIVALAAAVPALPRVFDMAETLAPVVAVTTDAIPLVAERRDAAAIPSEAGMPRRDIPARASATGRRQAEAKAAPPDTRLDGAAAMGSAFARPAASAAISDAGPERTTTLDASEVTIGSRPWSGHVPPPGVAGQVGVAQDSIGGRAGASEPFRTIGSAFSRAGVGTGRWFSRAGASLASAVVSK